MRKIREVLRLHSLGLKQRQIARSCSVGQSTVSEYIKAADAAALRWPDSPPGPSDRLCLEGGSGTGAAYRTGPDASL